MKNNLSGFTLIELMIAVAIIGLLSAIAYPSYTEHLITSKRGIAQAELISFSNAMEQYYIQHGSDYRAGGIADAKPNVYSSYVTVDGANLYNLSISAITESTYTLTAAPISGTSQASDGNLTLTNTGARTWGSLTHW